MPDSLHALQTLALKYARMQHEAAILAQTDDEKMRQHIMQTLCRCLPESVVTASIVEECCASLRRSQTSTDPMHTGAIHAFARDLLLHSTSTNPLMQRLHDAACKYLRPDHTVTRDDLRLVSLAALYDSKHLPAGETIVFVRYRLGLRDGVPRSCEEIAAFMHKPLLYIHELETAILTILSSQCAGGHHA